MPHSFGYRAAGAHAPHVQAGLQRYVLVVDYHVGDIVDIKANAANKRVCPTNTITGNCLQRHPRVIVYKVIGNRYIEKRVNLRIAHVEARAYNVMMPIVVLD
ncbi:hypothetical protein C8R44DRAFT_864310 [Mycena epipterygia]|nr:hypothetical protein C8R44DRAFT_864310 [Mycena epipterygia]